MSKANGWRLIALGIGVSTAVGLFPARPVWSATPVEVESAAPGSANHPHKGSDVCSFDPFGHRVLFVTVEPGVHLEVLDWGGRARPSC